MTAAETQLLLARAVLLILLYTFIAAVGVVSWLELRAARAAGGRDDAAATRARLVIVEAAATDRPPGTSFALAAVNAIGRDLDNDVVLADPTISGRHAVVSHRDGTWWLEDLASTNGSFVNGVRAVPQSPALLRAGDVVQLGSVRLRLASAPE